MSANDSEHAEPQAQRRSPTRRKKEAGDTPNGAMLAGRTRAEATTPESSEERPSVRPEEARSGEAAVAVAPDDKRDEVWSLHLRGYSQRQIAVKLELDRRTVARLLNACYAEFGAERRARMKRKLDSAVARMQRIERQAWDDHDADDEREQAVLQAAVQGTLGTRYQSQRSQYLRLALDAEKEIARLEGLYAADVPDVLGVLFRIERVEPGQGHGDGKGSGDGSNDDQVVEGEGEGEQDGE